jgi:hypothetical protein
MFGRLIFQKKIKIFSGPLTVDVSGDVHNTHSRAVLPLLPKAYNATLSGIRPGGTFNP